MAKRLPRDLEQIEPMRVNQRFGTYSAYRNGRRLFVKQAKTDAMIDAIRREVWGMTAFNQLAEAGALAFEVPKVVDFGADYLVTSWAPGKPMRVTSASADADAAILAEMYASIDRATATRVGIKSSFVLPDRYGRTAAERLRTLLARVTFDSVIEPRLVEAALDLIDRDSHVLVGRLTHADLQPDNLLRTNHGRLTAIDFESASLTWPRFYDVVNHASNTLVRHPSRGSYCHELLGQFFEKLGESPRRYRKELNVIAAVRSISSIYEYSSDPDELHNTEGSLTAERAGVITQILERVVRAKDFLPATLELV